MIDAGHSKFRTRGSSIRKKGKLSVIILDIDELLGDSIALLSGQPLSVEIASVEISHALWHLRI